MVSTRTVSEPFREVAARIRGQITSRELQPGVRLPTARDLAKEHGVAVTTAVRAVALLRDEGLVVTTHGRGSYVAARTEIQRGDASRYANPDPDGLSPNRREAGDAGVWDEVDLGERGTAQASIDLASRLEIEEGAELSVVRYRWRIGGVPTQISTQWEPLEITRGTPAELPSPKDRGAPAIHARMKSIGWTICGVDEDYRARLPTPQEAELLEIPSSTPVLAITRVSHARRDDVTRPVETADIIMRADRVYIRSQHREEC